MKKKFLIMLFAVLYIGQLSLISILSPAFPFIKDIFPSLPTSKYFLIGSFFLSLLLILINSITPFLQLKYLKSSRKTNVLGWTMGCKLAFIPFFLFHFFWFIIIMGATANPFLYILWFFIPFLFLAYAYLILFSTSSYLIVQIFIMYKRGILTKGQCVLHIIMQLMFFTDVADSVYLFFKYRKLL